MGQTGETGTQKDGMDMALCAFDVENRKLEYSGAYNSLYLVRNNEIDETKADRMPIGIYEETGKTFTNHEIELQKGDTLYIFSDGFVDQFGGPKGKKFMSKRFRQIFVEIQQMNMKEQGEFLDKTIEEWKNHEDPLLGGSYEQMDDILVIGIRI